MKRGFPFCRLVAGALVGWASSTPAMANRYVDARIGSNTGDCTVEAAPCRTITYAMQLVNGDGFHPETVLVAPGTYDSTLGESFPIHLKSAASLQSREGAARTIIDASGTGARVIQNQWTVTAKFGPPPILQPTRIIGFTITGGVADGPAVDATDGSPAQGGGVWLVGNYQVPLIVERNIFVGNEARGRDAAAGATSAPAAQGGALFIDSDNAVVRNNVFRGNAARGGRGVDSPTDGGSALGGAVYALGPGSPNDIGPGGSLEWWLQGNTYYGNEAVGGAGGASLAGVGANGGAASGGAVYADQFDVGESIFVGNDVSGGAAGAGSPAGAKGAEDSAAVKFVVHFSTTSGPLFWCNLFDRNTASGMPAVYSTGSSPVIADPEFLLPPRDLRIRFDSPAASRTCANVPGTDVDGKPRTAHVIGAYEPITIVASTDLNDDGRSDVLWRNSSTGQIFRLLMKGRTIVGRGPVYTEPDTSWRIVADADFNGDGIADLLWRNDSTGSVYLVTINASGVPSGGALIYSEPNPDWKIVQAADVDGDGRADLVWWNSSTGQVYVMLMQGFTIGTQGFAYVESNTDWRIEAAADLSGSGKHNDLVWRNVTTGAVWVVTIGVSGGGFNATPRPLYQSSPSWRIIAAADFNADGRSDLLWRNDATGDVYMTLFDGASIVQEGLVYNEPDLAWKIVAVGDYDGNLRADILYRNETTGRLFMLSMDGLAIFNAGAFYEEPNLSWKVLGPWEYRIQ